MSVALARATVAALLTGAVPTNAATVDDARSFFEAYAADLSRGDKAAVIARYHRDGATVAGDGKAEALTRDGVARNYEGWQPPKAFAWRDLRYRALGARHVLVTGLFDWTTAKDKTTRYSYTAVLHCAARRCAIIHEDESRP